MNIIYAEYNMYRNSIDVYTFVGYMLRIDCNKVEYDIKTTPCSQCALNALALSHSISVYVRQLLKPLCTERYARLSNKSFSAIIGFGSNSPNITIFYKIIICTIY